MHGARDHLRRAEGKLDSCGGMAMSNGQYAYMQTPGDAMTLRIINENTVEYPFHAYVRPYKIASTPPEVVMRSSWLWLLC